MSLNDLYQEIILDHAKRPRNTEPLDGPTHASEGYNPLCGDQVRLTLKIVDGRIAEIRFHGKGCAISTASASMLTEAVKGMKLEEARDLCKRFYGSVMGEHHDELDDELGELAALGGVREFPSRVKCATLVWHALEAAMNDDHALVTTE